MMKQRVPFLILLCGFWPALLFWSCAEPAKQDSELIHPAGWADESSASFHGSQVSDLSICASCHGDNFQGGQSKVSCYTCHQYPHPSAWSDSSSHGAAVLADLLNTDESCGPCHLASPPGGAPEWSCWGCHTYFPHVAGWEASGGHGEFVAAHFDTLAACAPCHFNQTGGNDDWSCWQCHGYYPHTTSATAFKHGGLVRQQNYQVWICQPCHGGNYSGGSSNQSCVSSICHAGQPDACNTCHGNFYAAAVDTSSWAPPNNLLGEASGSLITVGAHQQHVNPAGSGSAVISAPLACTECHVQPSVVDGLTHLDANPAQAEVVFGALAAHSDGDSIFPAWSRATGECSDTYCHGNFPYGNPDNPPALWTNQNGSQIECDKCHLMPPPLPHLQITSCYFCHSAVVNADNEIIAPELHINGEQN